MGWEACGEGSSEASLAPLAGSLLLLAKTRWYLESFIQQRLAYFGIWLTQAILILF